MIDQAWYTHAHYLNSYKSVFVFFLQYVLMDIYSKHYYKQPYWVSQHDVTLSCWKSCVTSIFVDPK